MATRSTMHPTASAVSPKSPPRDELDEISFYLGRAYYNYVGLLERVLADMKIDAHLRPGMGHILFALYERDDRIIKDVVERTGLSASTLTGMLSTMERFGVIERHRDPDDGRAVRVRLTPLGRSLRPRCRNVLKRVSQVLHADLTEDEIRNLKLSLSRILAAMRSDEQRWRTKRSLRATKGVTT